MAKFCSATPVSSRSRGIPVDTMALWTGWMTATTVPTADAVAMAQARFIPSPAARAADANSTTAPTSRGPHHEQAPVEPVGVGAGGQADQQVGQAQRHPAGERRRGGVVDHQPHPGEAGATEDQRGQKGREPEVPVGPVRHGLPDGVGAAGRPDREVGPRAGDVGSAMRVHRAVKLPRPRSSPGSRVGPRRSRRAPGRQPASVPVDSAPWGLLRRLTRSSRRTSIRPSLTRVSYTGWAMDGGPSTTAPSSKRNRPPCQGQRRQSPSISPSDSGPPRCEQRLSMADPLHRAAPEPGPHRRPAPPPVSRSTRRSASSTGVHCPGPAWKAVVLTPTPKR